MAAAEIKHAVKRAEQRVQFVRAEQHGDAEFLLQRAWSVRTTARLMMRIEADQRFVQQQQARAAQQGLRQQQALALAAGGLGQRTVRELGGVEHVERPCTSRRAVAVEQRQTPAVAVGRRWRRSPSR